MMPNSSLARGLATRTPSHPCVRLLRHSHLSSSLCAMKPPDTRQLIRIITTSSLIDPDDCPKPMRGIPKSYSKSIIPPWITASAANASGFLLVS
jgi:hypothetical protein